MGKVKLLITGGAGLLGVNWAFLSRNHFHVFLHLNQRKIHIDNTSVVSGDLHAPHSIKILLSEVKPDIVIHTAGITNVELCESNPELAYTVNTEIPGLLSKECYLAGISFIHISTDHLFDGFHPMLSETAIVSPVNVYGQSKAKAELKVLENHPNSLVIRTNFYCWGTSYRHSFSDRIINSLRKNEETVLFEDVFYTPILAGTLVRCVHYLIEQKKTGIYHVVGGERISKLQFGVRLASIFELDESLIRTGKVSNSNHLVKRPNDMSLSNSKLCNVLNFKLPNLDEELKTLKQQEQSGLANEIINI